LENEFYIDNLARLRTTLSNGIAREVYKIIATSHSKFAKDITPFDLLSQWRAAPLRNFNQDSGDKIIKTIRTIE
jgi:hypothetical protein